MDWHVGIRRWEVRREPQSGIWWKLLNRLRKTSKMLPRLMLQTRASQDNSLTVNMWYNNGWGDIVHGQYLEVYGTSLGRRSRRNVKLATWHLIVMPMAWQNTINQLVSPSKWGSPRLTNHGLVNPNISRVPLVGCHQVTSDPENLWKFRIASNAAGVTGQGSFSRENTCCHVRKMNY